MESNYSHRHKNTKCGSTYGLDSEGTCVPSHQGHLGAQLIGCGLQPHPVDGGGAHDQHLHDAVRELPPANSGVQTSDSLQTFRLVESCHHMDEMLLHSRLLHSIAENRPEVWLTFSAQPQITINTVLCVAILTFQRKWSIFFIFYLTDGFWCCMCS